ncbi:DNA single-strand annealing protein RecT-like protein [gut metagenome]|uniref:DNA single-strand annealing protein RecT-like protein n=1 Tax=gut metagenome TaxID=749906 RepID=J9GET6_9ZZZZ
MSNIQLTVDAINKMQPLEIVESPLVRDRFISIWDTLWGENTGEAAYERESNYFNTILRETDNGKLQKATRFSIFTAFIDLAISGLSLEPGARALAYLIGRNVNMGTREKPVWEGRIKLTISGYGELVMRARCGQIRHADNPVLVYANDEFSFSDCNGRKEVTYKCNLPHAGQAIVACYLRITRADGSIDYAVMLEEDWTRLASYSMKQNRGNTPNVLYGMDDQGYMHIDPGFLMAKCIKHAFKTYPKVRIGRGTELQSEQKEEQDIDDFYGVSKEQTNPSNEEHHQEAAPFGNNDTPSGITVDADEDDAF